MQHNLYSMCQRTAGDLGVIWAPSVSSKIRCDNFWSTHGGPKTRDAL